MSKSIYILLSQTQTKFAKAIRKIGKQEYNHASISLDSDFTHVYSFARPQHNAVLLGGLVQESLERYTLCRDDVVPIEVFKLPVSDEEYNWVEQNIQKMINNPDYMYNLFSVLFYPFTKGFSVNKTFTCVEFAAYILQHIGYLSKSPCCRYTPNDLSRELSDHLIYQGDVRECMPSYYSSKNYFAPFTMELFYLSVKSFFKLTKRTCFNRIQL